MKNIYKLSFIVFLSVFTLFLSCETVELEKLQDPNALSPDQADPTLLFNSVQLNYKNTVAIFNMKITLEVPSMEPGVIYTAG